MWKSCGNVLFPQNCEFPQNFRTRKLGEITVLYAVFFHKKDRIHHEFSGGSSGVFRAQSNIYDGKFLRK